MVVVSLPLRVRAGGVVGSVPAIPEGTDSSGVAPPAEVADRVIIPLQERDLAKEVPFEAMCCPPGVYPVWRRCRSWDASSDPYRPHSACTRVIGLSARKPAQPLSHVGGL